MNTRIQNVTMEFKSFRALKNVSFRIEQGDFVAILGPSGCGKTTLLRLLAGFNKPAAGEIYIANTLVADKSYLLPPNKRNISMVFQSYALWPHMTVEKNIAFPIQNSKFVTEDLQRNCAARVKELLKMVGLEGLEKRLPSQLSGGQRQRVALARALAINPALLMMDEPLSNLDTELRNEMRREIKRLHNKTKATVVYVTHDQGEALALANKIVVMNQGEIQQIGTPQEIYENPGTPFVAKFVGRSNLIPGKWEGAKFIPMNSEVIWDGAAIGVEFKKKGLFPVKPENLVLVEEGRPGFAATIVETEYQGNEMRIIASTASGEKFEVSHKSHKFYQEGDRVVLNR